MQSSRPRHCKEAGSVAAAAGGHPGLPSGPTGDDRRPEKCHWSLHHKDMLGGYFGSGKLAAPRPNNIGEVFVGCCPLPAFLEFTGDLEKGF